MCSRDGLYQQLEWGCCTGGLYVQVSALGRLGPPAATGLAGCLSPADEGLCITNLYIHIMCFPPTDLHPDQSEGELFAFVCVLSVSVYVWPLGILAQSHHWLDLGTCCSLTSAGLPDWALPNGPQCSRRQSQMTQSCQIPLLRVSVKHVFSTLH